MKLMHLVWVYAGIHPGRMLTKEEYESGNKSWKIGFLLERLTNEEMEIVTTLKEVDFNHWIY